MPASNGAQLPLQGTRPSPACFTRASKDRPQDIITDQKTSINQATRSTAKMLENAIDETTLQQYLADDPPTVVPLAIKPHFEALTKQEKK